jgi:hypothetical protein
MAPPIRSINYWVLRREMQTLGGNLLHRPDRCVVQTLGLLQRDDGGSPSAGFRRGVVKVADEGGIFQDGADHFALRANSTAVDDTERFNTQAVGFQEVFFHYPPDVARRHGVKIEHVGNGNPNRFFGRFHEIGLKNESPVSQRRPGDTER